MYRINFIFTVNTHNIFMSRKDLQLFHIGTFQIQQLGYQVNICKADAKELRLVYIVHYLIPSLDKQSLILRHSLPSKVDSWTCFFYFCQFFLYLPNTGRSASVKYCILNIHWLSLNFLICLRC